jgi:hypothetical protein
MQRCLLIIVALMSLQRLASALPPTTAPSSPQSAESKPVEKDGVSVTVATNQRSISADEQPGFVVRFKNTSADYINLYDVQASWDWQIRFTNTDKRAGHPGPWLLRMDKLPHRYPIAHKQIKAGESLEVAVNLADPPFTFDFVYEGETDKPVAPVRRLGPGKYQMTITITLPNPFGPGHHLWVGPLTTDPLELEVRNPVANGRESQPTAQEIAAYDSAIDQVTKQLEPHGLWLNGGTPEIKLPPDAKPEDVIASAVNRHMLESKAYHILRVRRLDRPTGELSVALVRVGTKTRVLVFFPTGKIGWWTRFYDTDLASPATRPATP